MTCRYDPLRDVVVYVKSALLAQMKKFKGIGQYGELIPLPLQLLLLTQLLHFVHSLSTIIVYSLPFKNHIKEIRNG
jgi:hypothetical protein